MSAAIAIGSRSWEASALPDMSRRFADVSATAANWFLTASASNCWKSSLGTIRTGGERFAPATESATGGAVAESLEYEPDAQLAELQKDLIALGTLETDWDSYGGLVPSETTIAQASHIMRPISQLLLKYIGDLGLPSVSPMPDGGIDLEWSDSSRTGSAISVLVSPDSSLSYFKRLRSSDGVQYSEGPVGSPSDLVSMILELVEHGQ